MFLDFVYLIISFVAGVINIINLGALPSTGGAAFLQTSKGSIFDPFTSGVLLQSRHLSSFLYIIYTASFT